MKSFKKTALIIGAGPSGLACAYELLKTGSGIKPIIVEKLPVAGGLSRTVYDGKSGVDIGGHRLYTTDEYIQSIWDEFLPHQSYPSIDDIAAQREKIYPTGGKDPNKTDNVMLIRRRFSSILFDGKTFDYPVKFNFDTVVNLGLWTTIKAGLSYLKSIFVKRKENNLEDFFINRFGNVLYSIFFKDYTKKVWGFDASELSFEWGHERIKKLSLLKTILNSVFGKFMFFRKIKDKSLIDEFYYPKFGCSQLWNLMADYIINNGGEIIYNADFKSFSYSDKQIYGAKYVKDGNEFEINANYFISSAPICDLIKGIDVPFDVKQNALNLPYRDYILVSFYTNQFNLKNRTDYKTVNNITPECWLYLQETSAIAARIQIMNNWSPYLVEDFLSCYLISLEYFVNENDDFWNKTDDEIIEIAKKECEKYNLFTGKSVLKTKVIREKKAYPTYCGSYKHINRIISEISKYRNLFLIGRNGQHKYNNMDEAMISGVNAARKIIGQVK